MRISARADYAVRAVLELAVHGDDGPVKAETIATTQDIPHKFLEGILGDLRRAGIVDSRRGGGGGYRLARAADAITVADVIRAVDGPIVSVRGERPTGLAYTGSAEPLPPVDRPARQRPPNPGGRHGRRHRDGRPAGAGTRARGGTGGLGEPVVRV